MRDRILLTIITVLLLPVSLWGQATVQFPDHMRTYNVADFGAKGDDKTRNTEAIQKAIDEASAAGGGRIIFPKGTYLTGSIYLKSNIEFIVDEGVEIKGVQDSTAYPFIWTRVAGIEMEWPSALINVLEQQNVRIVGEGIINGNGEYWWDKFNAMRQPYTAAGLRWALDYDCFRPRLMLIWKSSNVELLNFTLKKSPFWTVHMCYSNHITVDGITICENTGPSSDGIDIDSSSDILVQNCDIDCNDDNFCIKAGKDADGLRVNIPTERVVIRDCIARRGGGMFTIGSETSGGVRDIHVYNIKATGTLVGIRLKSAKTRGGVIENIVIENIEMEHVNKVFEFSAHWYPQYSNTLIPENYVGEIPERWKTLAQPVIPAERGIPVFRGITIKNLKVTGAVMMFDVMGLPDIPLRNVTFENLNAEVKDMGRMEYMEGLIFTSTTIIKKIP